MSGALSLGCLQVSRVPLDGAAHTEHLSLTALLPEGLNTWSQCLSTLIFLNYQTFLIYPRLHSADSLFTATCSWNAKSKITPSAHHKFNVLAENAQKSEEMSELSETRKLHGPDSVLCKLDMQDSSPCSIVRRNLPMHKFAL